MQMEMSAGFSKHWYGETRYWKRTTGNINFATGLKIIEKNSYPVDYRTGKKELKNVRPKSVK